MRELEIIVSLIASIDRVVWRMCGDRVAPQRAASAHPIHRIQFEAE